MSKKKSQSAGSRRIRSCGCVWYDGQDPMFPCRDAGALLASRRFAEMLSSAMPGDWLCRRLVEVTRAALDRHYGISPAFSPGPEIVPPLAISSDKHEQLFSRRFAPVGDDDDGEVSMR